jgi:molybdenum cofactor biosynthesis enzyme MoaA
MLLDDVASGTNKIRVKISGGEPLLRQNEVRNLLSWTKRPDVVERILVSNLAGAVDGFIGKMATLGITEVRANLPSLDPVEYVALTGSAQPRLDRVLERCRRVHGQGVLVRANVVVTDSRLGKARSFAEHYALNAVVGRHFDHIAFIVDARSSNQDRIHSELLAWLHENASDLVSVQNGRVIRARYDNISVSVVKCVRWGTPEARDRDIDTYVVAPGRRVIDYTLGRAYFAPRHAMEKR